MRQAKPETRQTTDILYTKLRPPRPQSRLIDRPGLAARLQSGVERKLTLVCAPTGSGKTTLVSRWLAQSGLPAAWLTLEAEDNDPARFWTYVITALRTIHPDVGKASLSMLSAGQPQGLIGVLTSLINDLAKINDPYVLALEDYQAITSSEIHAAVSYLLQRQPESLHLVIIARSEPDLPLGILRARGELVEIGPGDLRFSPDEIIQLLHEAYQMELPGATARKLFERTEGWAAGLHLLVLSIPAWNTSQDIEPYLSTFTGSHRYVADYLIREVFSAQTAETQATLLNTCFFPRLTGALVDELMGRRGGGAALEAMARDNLFIARLESTGGVTWYSYHPLFAESLQPLARQKLGDDGVQALYQKASEWYESQQAFGEAIEVALLVADYERALKLINRFIEIHNFNELHTLGRWLDGVPSSLIYRNPEICLIYAQVILYSGDRYAPETAARIEPFLQAAETAWRQADARQKVGIVSSLRGMIAMWQGNFDQSFEYVHRSLEELGEYDILWRGVSLLNSGFEAEQKGQYYQSRDRALESSAMMGATQNIHGKLAAMYLLAKAYFQAGDLEQAAQLAKEIMAGAQGGVEMLDDQCEARLMLAAVAYERGELAQAETLAAEALEMARQRDNEEGVAQAASRLAVIQSARGELAQARQALDALTRTLKIPLIRLEIQAFEGRLAVLASDRAWLAGWLAMIQRDQPPTYHAQKEREAFVLARLALADGKLAQARESLAGWTADALENGRLRSAVECLCITAAVEMAAGQPQQAAEAMLNALSAGQEKGLRRLFIDEGAGMVGILQAVIPLLPKRSLSLYASTLLHFFPVNPGSEKEAGRLIEPLSQQEIRVLRLLSAGLSNNEIARELIVSTNTVKTHVKAIYQKLSVNSRDEAREMARDLNLI